MSYREATLRAEEKSRAIVATWPGYHRDLLAEWMKLYDSAPVTQSILDYTPRFQLEEGSLLQDLARGVFTMELNGGRWGLKL